MTLPTSTPTPVSLVPVSLVPVSLRAVIEALEIQSELSNAYLHRRSNEIIILSHDEMSAAETSSPEELDPDELAQRPAWEQEVMAQAAEVIDGEDYLKLPSKFDLHEWRMMEKFCYARSDDARRERLLNAIHGRGAFRHFRSSLSELELQEWYHFRGEEFAHIAKGWLEVSGIAYQDDRSL